MDCILTAEGIDITHESLRTLNRTVSGLTIDGDALASTSANRLCVVCHWPAHECTCNAEVCS